MSTPQHTDNGMSSRNEEYVASTGPIVHVPPVLLPPPYLVRLVARIHAILWLGRQAGLDVRHRPLSGRVFIAFGNIILSRRTPTRSWYCRSAWAQTTTRPVRPARRHKRRRGPRIRILLRCLHTSILSALCPPLHYPVHPNAGHKSPEPRIHVLCEPAIPCGRTILESDHLFGL